MAKMRTACGPVGDIECLMVIRDNLPGKMSFQMIDHLVKSGFVLCGSDGDFGISFKGLWFLHVNKK
jgi:hypothetical protein